MMVRQIRARLDAAKRSIGDRLPAPMAAPETPQLRRMRVTLITELAMLAVLTAAVPARSQACLRAIGAFAWLALAGSSVIVGLRWLTAKIRADDAWAVREREE